MVRPHLPGRRARVFTLCLAQEGRPGRIPGERQNVIGLRLEAPGRDRLWMSLHVGADPAEKIIDEGPDFQAEIRMSELANLFVPPEPLREVLLYVSLAKMAGHLTRGREIIFQDGIQPILRLRISKGIHRVGLTISVNVGHAPPVAIDAYLPGFRRYPVGGEGDGPGDQDERFKCPQRLDSVEPVS